MALLDLEAFLVERLQAFDSSLDVSAGSPCNVKVVQPLLRRLGSDPYTVDIGVFVQTTLNQQFPDMPTKEGDAITDLLIKAAVVLWSPVVRESARIANALSFRDPTTLTTDEAEALGANLFAKRNSGDFARGTGRIYFAQPQNVTVNPVNFFTSKSGLNFYPTQIQSIRSQELLLNVDGSLYYFDVELIAEQAGDAYNIDADELVTIANVQSAARVTNQVRFRQGTSDEDAVSFINRAEQGLTERSLVTQRGIVAKVIESFPEVTRLNTAGFNDPEMQRDVLTGGGLGELAAAGFGGTTASDLEQGVTTRRFYVTDAVDFTALIGPAGPVTGVVLTLHGGFAALPLVRDVGVARVVDAQTLDLAESVLSYARTNLPWALRRKSLTLSGIPGGILYPDGPNGTVSIPDDQVHIGGASDIFVRGAAFDAGALALADIVDDAPLLQGVDALVTSTTTIELHDFNYGASYDNSSTAFASFQSAAAENLSVQLLDAPNAGTYRILAVVQQPGLAPVLTVTPALSVVSGGGRWRITRELLIDLVEPKETKVSGTDLRVVQGRDTVDTLSGVDFDAYGVAPGDVLRVLDGPLIKGDYTVQEVLSPLYTRLRVDRKLPASLTDASFTVFRRNVNGGLQPPFIRIKTIDLLDVSSQPVGTTIPYARPVDCQAQGFANSAHGVKAEVTDARLGIVSLPFPAGAPVTGLTLAVQGDGITAFTVTFTGPNPVSVASMVAQLNARAGARIATALDGGLRLGLIPISPFLRISSGSGLPVLFGSTAAVTSHDIASDTVRDTGGWTALRPRLDTDFDVLQVLDGVQVGFYANLLTGTPGDPLEAGYDFNPEVGRHVVAGARSLGTARMFFLDPTSIEVDPRTVFTLTGDDGAALRFFPDSTNDYQRIPALPNGTKPLDGATGGTLAASTFQSATTDFIAKGIRPGDLLTLDFVPIVGTVPLTDPALNLHGTTLILSISGGPNKVITFLHDSASVPAGAVTRQGVIDQINRTVGKALATLDVSSALKLAPGLSLIVRPTGTANALLGFSASTDQSNESPNAGTYTITAVGPGADPHLLTLATALPTGTTLLANQQFTVLSTSLQRIVSTQMAKQLGAAGLYYFDVELVSEGTGDQYNIAADQQLMVEGYRADGYYLTTQDKNMSFSSLERPMLHLSRSILEVGASDDPNSATQLLGQNIQVNYDRSTLTDNVDSFARSEGERVITQSPLARHLIPYFVRFDLSYYGGSKEDVVTPDLEKYIQELYPVDMLTVSDLERICSGRGASSVDNPVDLVAVVHNFDRTVTVERSQDRIGTSRLSAFIPDVLNVKRRLG